MKNLTAVLVSLCMVTALSVSTPSFVYAADGSVSKDSAPDKPRFPKGAWALESIGAVFVGVGIVGLALGYGSVAQRDQQYDKFKAGDDTIKASDISSLESKGKTFVTAGWIVLGVGVAAVLTGAIWMLADGPSTSPTQAQKAIGQAQTTPPIAPPTQAQTLLSIR